jgi:hypothetical protein
MVARQERALTVMMAKPAMRMSFARKIKRQCWDSRLACDVQDDFQGKRKENESKERNACGQGLNVKELINKCDVRTGQKRGLLPKLNKL